jgi:hypothetical protein
MNFPILTESYERDEIPIITIKPIISISNLIKRILLGIKHINNEKYKDYSILFNKILIKIYNSCINIYMESYGKQGYNLMDEQNTIIELMEKYKKFNSEKIFNNLKNCIIKYSINKISEKELSCKINETSEFLMNYIIIDILKDKKLTDVVSHKKGKGDREQQGNKFKKEYKKDY